MGDTYNIIDIRNGYSVRDDEECLFTYHSDKNDTNTGYRLVDSESKELVLTTKEIVDNGEFKYSILDNKNTVIFEVQKNYYFNSLDVKGIFGDFVVSSVVNYKRGYKLTKNGLVIATISDNNKFCDNHLSLEVFKDEFSFVAIVVYLLIDINKFF